MKYLKILMAMFFLILAASAVSAHGVDVTADTMVVANDTNGVMVKDIAEIGYFWQKYAIFLITFF